MSIEITRAVSLVDGGENIPTAWVRFITLDILGELVECSLHWDECDGYELTPYDHITDQQAALLNDLTNANLYEIDEAATAQEVAR